MPTKVAGRLHSDMRADAQQAVNTSGLPDHISEENAASVAIATIPLSVVVGGSVSLPSPAPIQLSSPHS